MNDSIKKIITALTAAKKPAIFCHMRPDGDTLGSAFALRFALKTGADVFCDSGTTDYYDIIPGITDLNCKEFVPGAYELLIAVDCADAQRLGRHAAAFLKHPNTVSIDHHHTNDSFARLNYVAPGASSTGEIIYNLLKEAGLELSCDIAVCLYIAICTDTGNFTHSNTTSEVYMMAAGLLKYQIDVPYLNAKLYKEMSACRLRLLAKTLGTLKLYEDGKIAAIEISLKDFAECGCKGGDTEGFVEYAVNCRGALIGLLISEIARDSYKVSLRSKAGIDVSRIAAAFNGGGHKQAAGCLIGGKLPDLTDKLIFECKKEL